MKILKEIFTRMQNAPQVPPESGGILGGRDGIITHWAPDPGLAGAYGDTYVPEVQRLNAVIRQWSEEGISFYGIYHTHFPGGDRLSPGDLRYIGQILMACPPETRLCFPIVLPEDSIYWYTAQLRDQKLIIKTESPIFLPAE